VFIAFPLLLMWGASAMVSLANTQPDLRAEIAAEFAADERSLLETVARAEAIHGEGSFADNVVQRLDDLRFKLVYFLFWATPVIG
ncbi:hypothetical protein, partial [Klebsiella pneumoniae]|uniref:hypothetical protein n=1 Tax=Klebsiella pneumoniae TaxID=573 RepID=UPI002731EF85